MGIFVLSCLVFVAIGCGIVAINEFIPRDTTSYIPIDYRTKKETRRSSKALQIYKK